LELSTIMKTEIFVMVLIVLVGTVKADPGLGFIKKIIKTVAQHFDGPSEKTVNGKPAFCGDYDCPAFDVINKTDDYELRCYEKAYWVSTTSSGTPTPMGGENKKMFMKLFEYIKGDNQESAKIAMTVPVLNEVKGNGDSKKLKMSFFIPEKFQNNPPGPTDPTVFIEKKKFCAYVRTFGGYPLFYSQYEAEINKLKKDLLDAGLKYRFENGLAMYAGYDEPWKIFGRRNEVMLLQY